MRKLVALLALVSTAFGQTPWEIQVFTNVTDMANSGSPVSLNRAALTLTERQIFMATNTMVSTNVTTRIYSGVTDWSWELMATITNISPTLTINSTDGVVPVRLNSGAFEDSAIKATTAGVGIGTTPSTAANPLKVYGAVSDVLLSVLNVDGDAAKFGLTSSGNTTISTGGAKNVLIQSNGTTVATFYPSGNVSLTGKVFLDEASNVFLSSGTGSPEGVVTAGIGSVWLRKNGSSASTLYLKETGTGNTGWITVNKPIAIPTTLSDLTTAITTGTSKGYFRMPFAMKLTGVRCSLLTAQTSGSIFTVDVNQNGSSVLSTKVTIDNTEKTSVTAGTAPVISNSTLTDDAEITFDVDQVGDGTAKGCLCWLLGE
jgi:hypothetical protein